MSEYLSPKEHEPAARRYWRAADLVYELEQLETDEAGVTTIEYVRWINEIVAKGIGGRALLLAARQLTGITVDADSFGRDLDRVISPQLDSMRQTLLDAYKDGVVGTVEECNAFLLNNPDLITTTEDGTRKLEQLSMQVGRDGAVKVSPHKIELYVDTHHLPLEHRKALVVSALDSLMLE